MIITAFALGVIFGWCLRWHYTKRTFDKMKKVIEEIQAELNKLSL